MNDSDVNEILGRRRSPRREYEALVGVMVGGKYSLERCHEVGESGMTISTKRPIRQEGRLLLTFFIQNQPIAVRAQVRLVLPAQGNLKNRYGVEFINLDFSFKRVIRNFVALATELKKTGSGS